MEKQERAECAGSPDRQPVGTTAITTTERVFPGVWRVSTATANFYAMPRLSKLARWFRI